VARLSVANVSTTVPSLPMMNVARLAQPSASLNTPYALATSPWGQKSESTGNPKPCSSAHLACAWRLSHDTASTCMPAFSYCELSSRSSHSSPWHTPVNVNG
jgi:hypothetical protein